MTDKFNAAIGPSATNGNKVCIAGITNFKDSNLVSHVIHARCAECSQYQGLHPAKIKPDCAKELLQKPVQATSQGGEHVRKVDGLEMHINPI